MARPLWLVALIKRAFGARFAAARATRVPLVGHAMEHLLFEGDDLLVLPKQRTIRVDRVIGDDFVETVLPSLVVEHFIEVAGFHWLMDRCIGCGTCVEACPQQAIELDLDLEQPVGRAIQRLSRAVDVS